MNEMVNDAMVTDPAAIGDCFTWMLSSGLQSQLGDIRVPTLIMVGAKDPTSPDASKLDANGIKGSRFELFEESGHFIPIESPQKFVYLLTSFIKDVNKG